MLKADSYSAKGIKGQSFTIPKTFEGKENYDLLVQSLRVFEWGGHPGLSRVKTRSQIKRTKSKWYRQKGTGRARHGARSAPIFVGGGVAHGPKGIKKKLNLSKKVSREALKQAMTLKIGKNELIVINSLSDFKKTKDVQVFLKKVSQNFKIKNLKFMFVLADKNKSVQRFIKNIKNAETVLFKNLNARRVFFAGVLVLDKDIFSAGDSAGKTGVVKEPKENKKTKREGKINK